MGETRDEVDRIWDGLADHAIWMFTTVGRDGLHARPMSIHADRAARRIWLITDRENCKIDEVARNTNASLTLMKGSKQIAVAGVAEIRDDRDKLREIWSTAAEAFFPDGPGDPKALLIGVAPTHAEIWDNDNSLVASVKILMAAATDQRPRLGDVTKVDLRDR